MQSNFYTGQNWHLTLYDIMILKASLLECVCPLGQDKCNAVYDDHINLEFPAALRFALISCSS